MIEVDTLTVHSLSRKYLLIDWTIESTIEDVTDYQFYVEKSESPEGPFDEIAGPLVDTYEYQDFEVSLIDKWRKLYYRIRIYKPATEEQSYSEARTTYTDPDIIALEIIRRENLLLELEVGTLCWIIPRKTFGQRCPQCWSEAESRVIDSQCEACYKTGFIDGFLNPIQVYINLSPSPKSMIVANFGELEPNECDAWMSNYPLIKPKDMIVETTNKRWRVINQAETEKKRIPVRQLLRLKEIQPGDIEDKLHVADA